MIYFSYCPTIN